jgi:hypothetical protein
MKLYLSYLASISREEGEKEDFLELISKNAVDDEIN